MRRSEFESGIVAQGWRLIVFTGMVVWLVGSSSWAADEKVVLRRAWGKRNAKDLSYFVPTGNRRWVELNEAGNEIYFEEEETTGSMVQLLDRGRSLRIRLKANRAELAVGDGDFRPWVEGDWVSLESLPDYAKLAPTDYRVRLIYFVPTDREITANYESKIRCVMSFVNSLYRYEFRRRGWPDRGLVFETDESGDATVHLIRAKHEAAYYSNSPNYDGGMQYNQLVPEIPKSIGHPSRHLIVAFMETYDSGPAHFEWPGGVALGGRWSSDGGLGIFSSWILRDEFCAADVSEQVRLLRDATPILGRVALGHGRPDSPRFEFIEDGFGAVMHEVGHALGLPHDQREDRYYIMGNGFRQLQANLDSSTPVERRSRFSDANANILSVSRYLNPSADLEDQENPQVEATLKATEEKDRYRVSVRCSDNGKLRAILLFDEVRASVVAGDELNGQTEDSWEQIVELRRNPEGQVSVNVIVADRGGNLQPVKLVAE